MARSDDQNNSRAGDILGLGDVVPGDSTAPHTSQRPDEVRKRHARMQEGADDMTNAAHEQPSSGGAASVDMGAGGEGTDIEER
jgi:hypothetical protein